MNLTRLQTFLAVVRAGTFAAAAEALSFTPSAVSQQISKLEAEAGVSLLLRGAAGPGKQVELTEAGRLLHAHALAITAAVGEARDDLAALRPEGSDRLRLGSFPAVTASLVPRALRLLRSSFPIARPEVIEGDAWEGMHRGRLDLALCARVDSASSIEDTAVVAVRLARAPLAVAMPVDHPLAACDSLPLSALDGATLVGSRVLPEVAAVMSSCAAAGGRISVTGWNVAHPSALAALAAAGEGLAILPSLLVGVPPSGAVLRPLADGPAWELLALRSVERPSLTATAMLDALHAAVAAEHLRCAPMAAAA